jgi:hypothetical protein
MELDDNGRMRRRVEEAVEKHRIKFEDDCSS